jgi:hypothetical protein
MEFTCTETRQRLSGYLDRALSPPEREAVGRHLVACRDCDAALAQTRALTTALADLDRVELPEGFSRRFSERLRAEAATRPAPARAAAPRRARRAWWTGGLSFGSWPVRGLAGVAVAFLLVFAFLVVGPEHRTPGPGVGPQAAGPGAGSVRPVDLRNDIGMGQDAVVKIWFDASQDVQGVRFTLNLPPGVRMVQDGKVVDSPSLTWEGNLKAGRNLIPLQVRGVAKGEWTVTASVEKAGARKEKSIGLRVDGV